MSLHPLRFAIVGTSAGRRGGAAMVVPLLMACAVASADSKPPSPASANPPPTATPPEPTAETAVIELPADGFLQGHLAASAPGDGRPLTKLLWKSPLFAQPIEFRLGEIQRIRHATQAAPVLAESWRADLPGGDSLIGELESIDADHVVMRVPGVTDGPLRIRRAAVARLARPTSAFRVVVPGDLAGWNGPGGAVRGEAGRILFTQSESWVTRDVKPPSRACFDIAISWDERPEFEIRFAGNTAPGNTPPGKAGGKPDANTDGYRIETSKDDVIAMIEAATARFDSIGSLAAGAGGLNLLVFIDQERGRLAVVAGDGPSAGRLLFDETVAPRNPPVAVPLGIRIRKGGLRIDSLRVAPWKTEEPRLPKTADFGGPDAAVEAFDRTKGVFSVRTADGVRDVPAAEVSEIEFPAPTPATPTTAETVLAVLHGGSRLTGKILEVTASGWRIDCAVLAKPLECGFSQIPILESRATAAGEIPGRPGLLEAAGARMLGCLVSQPTADSGIGWLARGAVAPVAVGSTAAMRISYNRGVVTEGKEAAAGRIAPPKPASGPANVFLKTGDSIQCTVLSIGPEGARIKTDLEADFLVPAAAMAAAELMPSAAARLSKEKSERLLTVPRMQLADPPTHLLRLPSGDYLRGKLVSLDDTTARFDLLGTVKELPRSQATRLIWLSFIGDDSLQQAEEVIMKAGEPGSVPVRAIKKDGRRLFLAAKSMEGERLLGRSGGFGRMAVDLAGCDHLMLGPAAKEAPTGELPYMKWQLKPAALPSALQPR